MRQPNAALVVDADPARAVKAVAMLVARGYDPVTVVSNYNDAVVHARIEQLDFALLAAEVGGADLGLLATLLSVRAVPFGFISAALDGSDIPANWRARPFLAAPFTDPEFDAVLLYSRY